MGDPWSSVGDEVAALFDDLVRRLERQGARLCDVRLRDLPEAGLARRTVQYAEAAAYHAPWLAAHESDYDPTVRALLAEGRAIEVAAVRSARRLLARFRRSVAACFHGVDVLVAPTTPRPAWTFAEAEGPARLAGIALTAPFTATGLPVVSAPMGFAPGHLPVGIQVGGPSLDQGGAAIRVAMAIDRTTGAPFVPPLLGLGAG